MPGGIPADPLTEFAASFGGGLGKGIGDGIGGSMKPMPAISGAQLNTYGTTIGNDGWAVNFGNAASVSATGGAKSAAYKEQDPGILGLNGGAPQQAGISGWLMLGMVGIIAVKLLKK